MKKTLLATALLFGAAGILSGSDVLADAHHHAKHHAHHHAKAHAKKESKIGTLDKKELADEIMKTMKKLYTLTGELEKDIEAKADQSTGDDKEAWKGIYKSYAEKQKEMKKHDKEFISFLETYVM